MRLSGWEAQLEVQDKNKIAPKVMSQDALKTRKSDVAACLPPPHAIREISAVFCQVSVHGACADRLSAWCNSPLPWDPLSGRPPVMAPRKRDNARQRMAAQNRGNAPLSSGTCLA